MPRPHHSSYVRVAGGSCFCFDEHTCMQRSPPKSKTERESFAVESVPG